MSDQHYIAPQTVDHAPVLRKRHRAAMVLLTLICVASNRPTAGGQITVVNDAAHQQFVLAYRLLQRQQVSDAIQAFDTYLGSFPDDAKHADALYYRALLATRENDLQTASDCLSHIGETTVVPGHAIALLAGQVHMAKGRYAEALHVLEPVRAHALEPSVRAPLLHLRGLAYQKTGNLPGAAAQLEAAAGLDSPLRARAAQDLGRVHTALGNPLAAGQALAQAIALNDPAVTPTAALLAGNLHYEAEEYGQALENYGIVLRRHQTSGSYDAAVIGAMWAALSSSKLELVLALHGQHTGAMHDDVLRIDATLLAATALENLKRHEHALSMLAGTVQTAAREGKLDRLLLQQVSSLVALERFAEAEQTLRDLVRQYPDSSSRMEAELLWATSDGKRGRLDEAFTRLSSMIDRNPDHDGCEAVLKARANLLQRMGRHQAAITDLQSILGQTGTPCCDPGITKVQLQLVGLYHRISHHDAAVALAEKILAGHREAALPIPPTVEQEVLYRKALALVHLQNYSAARDVFTALIEKHPQSPRVPASLHYRGLIRMADHPDHEAVTDLLSACGMKSLAKPLRINGWRMIALHHRRQEATAEALGALDQLEATAGRKGLTPDELQWMASEAAAAGRPDAALGYLQPLLDGTIESTRKSRAGRLFLAGTCHQDAGQPEEAVACFEQVVALGAGFEWEALLQSGHTLRSMERHQDAINAYNTLANANSTRLAVEALISRAAAYLSLARQHQQALEQESAVEQLQEARRDLMRVIVLHAHASISPLPQLAHIALHDVLQALVAAGVTEMKPRSNLAEVIQRYPGTAFETYARAMLADIDGRHAAALQLLGLISPGDGRDARFHEHIDTARQRIAHRL